MAEYEGDVGTDTATIDTAVDADVSTSDESTSDAEVAATDTEDTSTPTPVSTDLTSTQQEMVKGWMLNRDAQWRQMVTNLQNQKAGEAQAAPPANANDTSEVDSEIAAIYTDDDVGRNTRQAVDKHLNLLLKKRGLDGENQLTTDQVRRIAAGEAGVVRDQWRSGLATTQEVQDLVTRNVIAADEAELVQTAFSTALAHPNNKALTTDPKMMPLLLKSVTYDLIKEGKIKPHTRKRPTNPLQPAGGGNGTLPSNAQQVELDPKTSPFKSVRALDTDQAKAADTTSTAHYEAANRG
tara:strand:- start:640 stop:1524 length:885 start_codon:yes stop_codon:yes gene_type:complete